MPADRRLRTTQRALATALALTCSAAAPLWAPHAATASSFPDRRLDPPTTEPRSVPAIPGPAWGTGAPRVRDRVIRHQPRSLRRATASASSRSYRDPDGHSVRVEVSRDYKLDGPAVQRFVDFLGSLLHGEEMNRLSVYLAAPSEIARICGFGAAACYLQGREQMVVSGEEAQGDGEQPPREVVIAHEYGHHVALNRRNPPWQGIERGTKRWSSYERICRGIRRGAIRPRRYYENPGEAYAEAFAFYHYPDEIRWDWRIAQPDKGAFDAIYSDVTTPWSGGTTTTWEGRLSPATGAHVHTLLTPLDGRLRLELDEPPGANFELAVVPAPRRGGGREASPGSVDDRLGHTVCGSRSLRVAVRRRSGHGPFQVRARVP